MGLSVSEAFDPYHRWLGISPKHRPPNHYRLLGLELGESDPEVIRDAAERQMGHVRQYQLGQHVELSQQILNELAAAKACLLDPEKRAAYDASLNAEMARQRGAAVLPPSPPPPLPQAGEGRFGLPLPPAPPFVLKPGEVRPVRGRSSKLLWGGLVVIGVAVVLVALVPVSDHRPAGIAKPQQPVVPPPVAPPAVPRKPVPPNPAPAPQLVKINWVPIAARVAPAVVKLQTVAANGQAREGLGLVADPRGLLVTSAAIVEDCVSATAHFTDSSFETLQLPATLNQRLGLAVFRIKPQAIQPVATCVLVPVPGSPLALCRAIPPQRVEVSPLAVKGTVPRDEVLRRLGKPPENSVPAQFGLDAGLWLDLDGAIRAADCGGPVFNASGQLVGLLVWSDAARNAHFALPAGEIDGFLAKLRDTLTGPPPPAPPPQPLPQAPPPLPSKPAGPMFPSGKVFSDSFYSSASDPRALAQAAEKNPNEVIEVIGVGGYPLGYVQPGRFGAAAVFVDKKAARPGISFEYRDERREGLIQAWNEEGQRTYCCQYSNAKREGLCCLMENGQPRVAFDYRDNKCQGVLLIAGAKTLKSFTDLNAARTDPDVGPKLAEVEKIEGDVERIEKLLLKEFQDELKERERRKKVAKHNAEARKRIQEHSDKLNQERNESMRAIQNKVMGRP